MAQLPPDVDPSIDGIYARNATHINLRVSLPNGAYARVGRVLSVSRQQSNNVQVLAELGSQVMVELKKGITQYNFSISKLYVHNDVFDQIADGAVFGMELTDDTASGGGVILDQFSRCAINSISVSYGAGQVTVAEDCQVVTIGSSAGSPD